MTACQSIMLVSMGAPVTPLGGSFWSLARLRCVGRRGEREEESVRSPVVRQGWEERCGTVWGAIAACSCGGTLQNQSIIFIHSLWLAIQTRAHNSIRASQSDSLEGRNVVHFPQRESHPGRASAPPPIHATENAITGKRHVSSINHCKSSSPSEISQQATSGTGTHGGWRCRVE
mmetsp:Transcript_22176/g.44523  ORF Transcript_22176/g.44523 Transcript_22176/m.44523 type:complete len:174 (+) Transcript_22176:3825-4346(+)